MVCVCVCTDRADYLTLNNGRNRIWDHLHDTEDVQCQFCNCPPECHLFPSTHCVAIL